MPYTVRLNAHAVAKIAEVLYEENYTEKNILKSKVPLLHTARGLLILFIQTIFTNAIYFCSMTNNLKPVFLTRFM